MEVYFNQLRHQAFIDEIHRLKRQIEVIHSEIEKILAGMDYLIWQHSDLYSQRKAIETDLVSLILVLRRHVAYLEQVSESYMRTDSVLEGNVKEILKGLSGVDFGYANNVNGAYLPEEQPVSVKAYALPHEVLNKAVQLHSAELNPSSGLSIYISAEPDVSSPSVSANPSMLYTEAVYSMDADMTENAQYVMGVMRHVDNGIFDDGKHLTEAEVVNWLRDSGAEHGWFQMDTDDAWVMAQGGYPTILTYSDSVSVACPNTVEPVFLRVENRQLSQRPFIVQEYNEQDLRLYVHQ